MALLVKWRYNDFHNNEAVHIKNNERIAKKERIREHGCILRKSGTNDKQKHIMNATVKSNPKIIKPRIFLGLGSMVFI